MELLRVVLLLNAVRISLGFYAYDCAHPDSNITTISSHHVTPCKLITEPTRQTLKYVQVLVVKKYDKIETLMCSVTRSSLITYCGVASHSVAMPQGLSIEDSVPISHADCLAMYSTGTYITPFQHKISGLRSNTKNRVRTTDIGHLSHDASCSGADFTLYDQTYKQSVMQSQYTITMAKQTSTVSLATNEIVFQDGLRCKYTVGACSVEGRTYSWTVKEISAVCGRTIYNVLYEGYANITTAEGNVQIVMVESTSQRFAIATTGERPICGFTGYTTERDNLFILHGAPGQLPYHEDQINILDMANYLDSDLKFVYIERNIWNRTTDLYEYFMKRYCELNTAHLTSLLSLSRINPEEFAWSYTKKEGYTAITRGEVVHLIQCSQVEVMPQPSSQCFMEMPVSYQNDTYFMKPGSRILVRTGRPVECASNLPVMYLVNGIWMKIGGDPAMHYPPKTLDPNPSAIWKYGEIKSLHHLGILTQEQINRYKTSILLPLEHQAVQEAFISNAEGVSNYYPKNINYANSLNTDEYISTMSDKVISKIYGFWDFLVKYLGALLGFAILWDIVTGTLSIILNCLFLYRKYGFSSVLVLALWSTAAKHVMYGDTSFFTNRFRGGKKNANNRDETEDGSMNLRPIYPKLDEAHTGTPLIKVDDQHPTPFRIDYT